METHNLDESLEGSVKSKKQIPGTSLVVQW